MTRKQILDKLTEITRSMRVTITCLFISAMLPLAAEAELAAAKINGHGEANPAFLQGTAGEALPPSRSKDAEGMAAKPQMVEILEIDGINRKGKLRLQQTGETSEFSMVPYAPVIYRGGYTDLRYVEPGTRMMAFLQASKDGKSSRVWRLTDDLGMQLRTKSYYRVQQVRGGDVTMLTCQQKQADETLAQPKSEVLVDQETVVWKGTGKGAITDLKEGAELVINFRTGKATEPMRCAEIWADTASRERVVTQTKTNYIRFLTLRGLPAGVGTTTRETIEVDLFLGADSSLTDQFKEGTRICVAAADERLRTYGQEVDRVNALIRERKIIRNAQGVEFVRLLCEPKTMLEGFRPAHVVRVWAEGWPVKELPRQERLYPWDLTNLPDIGGLPKEPMLSLPFALPIPLK